MPICIIAWIRHTVCWGRWTTKRQIRNWKYIANDLKQFLLYYYDLCRPYTMTVERRPPVVITRAPAVVWCALLRPWLCQTPITNGVCARARRPVFTPDNVLYTPNFCPNRYSPFDDSRPFRVRNFTNNIRYDDERTRWRRPYLSSCFCIRVIKKPFGRW